MTAAPLTVYKLTVLYMLNRLKEPIAKERVSAFLLENGYANFASLLQTYAELEQQGLVRTESTRDKDFLILTDAGKESLFYFRKELSADIMAQADAYLKEKGLELLNERYLSAEYDRAPSGDYLVRLSVREKDLPIIDLTLSLPNLEAAEAACRAWKEKNQEIYASVIEKLF